MIILIVGAVCGGRFFMWGLFCDEGVFFLSGEMKLLSLFVIVVGGFIGWICSNFISFSGLRSNLFGGHTLFGIMHM